MSNRKSTKTIITEAVLAELPHIDKPLDKIMFEWWMTGNSGTCLRLSEIGDTFFRMANLEYYQCDIKLVGTSYYGFMVELSKKIKCPYFLGASKIVDSDTRQKPFIRLYDSKIAMMMTLYGDIQSYLDSIKVRK
jgi:hypothetical protein